MAAMVPRGRDRRLGNVLGAWEINKSFNGILAFRRRRVWHHWKRTLGGEQILRLEMDGDKF